MRPPVALRRPTLVNMAALACYLVSLVCHVVSLATGSWSSMTLDGVTWHMGIWRGCRRGLDEWAVPGSGSGAWPGAEREDPGEWYCSADVFKNQIFHRGEDCRLISCDDWNLGIRILMTLTLVNLFLLVFPILAYMCLRDVARHHSRLLVTSVVSFSLTAAFCHILTLILYGSEVGKVADSSLGYSFFINIISMFMELVIPSLVKYDKYRRYPGLENLGYPVAEKPRNKTNSSSLREEGHDFSFDAAIEDNSFRSRVPPAAVRTSVSSLSEEETRNKFAYLEGPTLSMDSDDSNVTWATEMAANMSYTPDDLAKETSI